MQIHGFSRLVAALLTTGLVGCATVDIPTDPDALNIEPAAVSHLRSPQTVALINAYPAEVKSQFKVGSGVTWAVEQKQLTNSAVVMLRRALEKQRIGVAPDAEKKVTLRVHVRSLGYTRVGPFGQMRARVSLDARFADGDATSIDVENSAAMNLSRAIDGAVLAALNELVTDKKFVAYMAR